MNLVFLLIFLVFTAFSTENENYAETLLELMNELEQHEKSLHEREQNVKIAEERLAAREMKFRVAEDRLAAREMKFHGYQEEGMNQLEQCEQDLQNLAETVLKREKNRENMLYMREENLKEREQKLHEEQEMLHVQKEILKKKQLFEKSIESNDAKKPKVLKITSKILGHSDLHPDESSDLFVSCDTETNKILWNDPKNLIRNTIKERIGSCLHQKGKTMSNDLFDCISSNWFPPSEAKSFVKELLLVMALDVDVNKRDVLDKTPLILASNFNADKAVFKLIERGAKKEAFDEYGNTALHWAAREGCNASCKILLQKKANVNSQDKYGWTPLVHAVQNGRVEIVKILLESGADTKVKDKYSKTVLYYAPQNCVDLLLNQSA